VADSRDQLKQHLEALEDFEPKYRAYVAEMSAPPADVITLTKYRGTVKVNDREWSEKEIADRKNELLELAPGVDEALLAAGIGLPTLGHPPAIGGGKMASGVTSLLFYHGDVGLDDSGFAVPNRILEMIVSGKGALKTKLGRLPTSPAPAGAAATATPIHWPKGLFGRLRFIPAGLGFIADLGGTAVIVYAVGKYFHLW
jgi:hypothetical protein